VDGVGVGEDEPEQAVKASATSARHASRATRDDSPAPCLLPGVVASRNLSSEAGDSIEL